MEQPGVQGDSNEGSNPTQSTSLSDTQGQRVTMQPMPRSFKNESKPEGGPPKCIAKVRLRGCGHPKGH